MLVVVVELGGWFTRSAAIAGARRHARGRARRLVIRAAAIAAAAERAGMLVVELELGSWSPGSAVIGAAAELSLAGMLELELGGWPACSWSTGADPIGG